MIQNRIKSERTAASLTQKQLADKFNQFIAQNEIDIKPVSYAAISRWETGENNPQNDTWTALANFFDVDTGYLRGYSSTRISDEHQMFKWIEEQTLSDDPDKDHAIKSVIESVYEELNDKIQSLKEQING